MSRQEEAGGEKAKDQEQLEPTGAAPHETEELDPTLAAVGEAFGVAELGAGGWGDDDFLAPPSALVGDVQPAAEQPYADAYTITLRKHDTQSNPAAGGDGPAVRKPTPTGPTEQAPGVAITGDSKATTNIFSGDDDEDLFGASSSAVPGVGNSNGSGGAAVVPATKPAIKPAASNLFDLDEEDAALNVTVSTTTSSSTTSSSSAGNNDGGGSLFEIDEPAVPSATVTTTAEPPGGGSLFDIDGPDPAPAVEDRKTEVRADDDSERSASAEQLQTLDLNKIGKLEGDELDKYLELTRQLLESRKKPAAGEGGMNGSFQRTPKAGEKKEKAADPQPIVLSASSSSTVVSSSSQSASFALVEDLKMPKYSWVPWTIADPDAKISAGAPGLQTVHDSAERRRQMAKAKTPQKASGLGGVEAGAPAVGQMPPGPGSREGSMVKTAQQHQEEAHQFFTNKVTIATQGAGAAQIISTPSGLAGVSVDGVPQQMVTGTVELAARLVPGARALLTLGVYFRESDQPKDKQYTSTNQLVNVYLLQTLSHMIQHKFPQTPASSSTSYKLACHIPFQDPRKGRMLFVENFGDQMVVAVARKSADDAKEYKFATLQPARKTSGSLPLSLGLVGVCQPYNGELHIVTLSSQVWQTLAVQSKAEAQGQLLPGLVSYSLDPAIWPQTFTPETALVEQKGAQSSKLGPQFLLDFVKGEDEKISRTLEEHLGAMQKNRDILTPWQQDVEQFRGGVTSIFAAYNKANSTDAKDIPATKKAAITAIITSLDQLDAVERRLDAKLAEHGITVPAGVVYQVVTDARFTAFRKEAKQLLQPRRPALSPGDFVKEFKTIFEKNYGKAQQNPYATQLTALDGVHQAFCVKFPVSNTLVLSRAQWLLSAELQQAQQLAVATKMFVPVKTDDLKLGVSGSPFASLPQIKQIMDDFKSLFTMPAAAVAELVKQQPLKFEKETKTVAPTGSPAKKPLPPVVYKNYAHWLQVYTQQGSTRQSCYAYLTLANLLIHELRENQNQGGASSQMYVVHLLRCCEHYETVFLAVVENFKELQQQNNTGFALLAELQRLGANIQVATQLMSAEGLQGYWHKVDQFNGLFQAVSTLITSNATLKAGVDKAPVFIEPLTTTSNKGLSVTSR